LALKAGHRCSWAAACSDLTAVLIISTMHMCKIANFVCNHNLSAPGTARNRCVLADFTVNRGGQVTIEQARPASTARPNDLMH
jgi:hypothetical protein